MSAWIWSARACHFSAYMGSSYMRARRAPRSRATQHMNLLDGEVLRIAPHLPDAAVGLLPVLRRALDLPLEDGPERLLQLRPRPGVQQHRVEHGPPHVVLLLVVGAVADPDRPGPLIAREVRQGLLGQLPLAADPVHDLQGLAVPAGVGDEVEEVVGLPVEAEGVEPPQGEGGVPDPGVAVVPVAFAVRRLRQAGGGRRQQGPGRGVGEALQGEGAALQVDCASGGPGSRPG